MFRRGFSIFVFTVLFASASHAFKNPTTFDLKHCIKKNDLESGRDAEFTKKLNDLKTKNNLNSAGMDVIVEAYDGSEFAQSIFFYAEKTKEFFFKINLICESQRMASVNIAAAELAALEKTFEGRKESVWKTAEGGFNYTRLAVDAGVGAVVGTAGGLIVHYIVKSKQTKSGFEHMRCSIAGIPIADWNDEFNVQK